MPQLVMFRRRFAVVLVPATINTAPLPSPDQPRRIGARARIARPGGQVIASGRLIGSATTAGR